MYWVLRAHGHGSGPPRVPAAALQEAFTTARTDNFTLYVPLGCYRVTDTLRATQPRNGRWQPVVVVGQLPPPGGARPTLVLPPSTPGFTSSTTAKPVLAPGAAPTLGNGPAFVPNEPKRTDSMKNK